MATTYYTTSDAPGLRSGLTVALSMTLQEAVDAAVGGDTVLICADADYSQTVAVDFDTNAGSVDAPIEFRGCNADGSDDGTVATIDGTGGTDAQLFQIQLENMYLKFENLVLQNATNYGIYVMNTSSAGGNLILENVRITESVDDGFMTNEDGTIHMYFIQCELDNNDAWGYKAGSTYQGGAIFYNCKIHHNGEGGILDQNYLHQHLVDCQIYKNTGIGYSCPSNPLSGFNIDGCVFYGNTSDGLAIHATHYPFIVRNSIFSENGGYGINTDSGYAGNVIGKNCCFYNNSSGNIDISPGTVPGTGHVLTDPKFTSVVNNAEDFSLQSDSPCLGVGIDGGIW